MALTKVKNQMIDGASVNVKDFGAVGDGVTDDTAALKNAIFYCYTNGGSVNIPEGVKYDYHSLVNYITGTVALNSPDTITGLTLTEDLTGCMVWNTTDGSIGIVASSTSTSITLDSLQLGILNSFTAGDTFYLSALKVGVQIEDNSRWSQQNNAGNGMLVGQTKFWLNSDDPWDFSANELWAYGQYHPAFVASNNNPSDRDGRASFIARKYGVNNKLQASMGFGLNPIAHTDSVVNPGAAADTLLTLGHDEGDHTNNLSSTKIAACFRNTDNNRSIQVGLGDRSRDDYNLHLQWDENSAQKISINSTNGGHKLIEWTEGAGNIVRSAWKIWSGTGQFSGMRNHIQSALFNFSVPDDSYSHSTFSNSGAAGTVQIYLPDGDAYAGYTITLVKETAQIFQATPTVTDQIYGTTAVNKYVRLTNVGDTVTLQSMGNGKWAVISSNGTLIYA
jgi:hypothetical protein